MDKIEAIAVFDIGKTNKNFFLFDQCFHIVYQAEEQFKTTIDNDGFECDDIELIEAWIFSTLRELLSNDDYLIVAVNFSCYGASLAFLDRVGNRLTPIYNYLKDIPVSIQNDLFNKYGGEVEFCRKTASPPLGLLLNSGIQICWMKKFYPEIFKQATSILHLPQYLSYLLTKEIVSDSTSIGCHTFLWDFDANKYHKWLDDANISLPEPLPNSHCFKIEMENKIISVGIGIHDSSAALVPYLIASKSKFLLVSTGTWCISINPFNHSILTAYQLRSDCLSFLTIDQKPVKSSRFFLGYIHDINTRRIADFFHVPLDSFKSLDTNEELIATYLDDASQKLQYFRNGIPDNYLDESIDLSVFANFSDAYHRLMFDLSLLNKKSIDLISDSEDDILKIYVSGGFARNEIFIRLLASFYPEKQVYTSLIANSSALGAALVMRDNFSTIKSPEFELGLKQWKSFSLLPN